MKLFMHIVSVSDRPINFKESEIFKFALRAKLNRNRLKTQLQINSIQRVSVSRITSDLKYLILKILLGIILCKSIERLSESPKTLIKLI